MHWPKEKELMKFRPLVRKLPTAPLDQLHQQETPDPQKTEDWGKVKVRRIFVHIKSEQESESEEKLLQIKCACKLGRSLS